MSTNSEIKEESIKTINKIFSKILDDLRKHPDFTNQTYFEHQLYNIELYGEALIHEVGNRKITCDHPLRAAFALEKLHNSGPGEFQDNYNNFKKQSQDSRFYPTTRRISSVVASCFVFAALVALTAHVSLFFIILAAPAGFNLFCHSIPTASHAYQDIYDAKEKSKEVCNFYSFFRGSSKPPPSYDSQPPAAYPKPG